MRDPGGISVTESLQGCTKKCVKIGNQCSVMLTKEPLSVFTAKHIMHCVLLESTEVEVGSKIPGKLN